MTEKLEGFWYSERQPELPKPVSEIKPDPATQTALPILERLESSLTPILYRGISICRLCGKVNGCGEYHHKDWSWPSGYRHYLTEHQVAMTPAFVEFLQGQKL